MHTTFDLTHVIVLLVLVLFIPILAAGIWRPSKADHERPFRVSSWNIISGPGTFVEAVLLHVRGQVYYVMRERFRLYGRTFETTSLGTTIVHTMEPENIKTIMETNANDWGVEGKRKPMQRVIGRGFVTTDGNYRLEARAAVKPSFDLSNISDSTALEKYIYLLFSKIPTDGTSIDLQPLLFDLHLDLSCMFLFGDDLGVLAGTSRIDSKQFKKNLNVGLRGAGLRMMSGPMASLLPSKQWNEACQSVHPFIEKYVDQAFEYRERSSSTSTLIPTHTLLYRLARENRDRSTIRDQLLNTLLASLENLAILNSNCVFVLAPRPDLWKQLKAEVETVVSDAELDVEKLRQLEDMRRFIDETLRLYPILWRAPRQALRDTFLPTGGGKDGRSKIFIPAGATVNTYPGYVQLDSGYWGPNVNEFNPNRWKQGPDSPWHFPAFGRGARACLASQKARLDVAYFLVRLLQQYDEIGTDDEREWEPDVHIAARSKIGCSVRLTKR